MHHSESIWGSDSQVFKPERWLGPDAKQLERFLVTFGKGGRQCIGIKYVDVVIPLPLPNLLTNKFCLVQLSICRIAHRDGQIIQMSGYVSRH